MLNNIRNFKKIVFAGTESTGKSYCSKLISVEYGIYLIEEQARKYLEKKGFEWEAYDILKIAEMQKNAEIEAEENQTTFFCDTDLLTIKIWLEFINENVPHWITNHLQNHPAFHYILMSPENIEWVEDGLRKNKNERDYIHQLYLKALADSNIPYTIINSKKESRINEIKEILKSVMIETA
jgi:nicotinamide riboside kinase